jgi:hypothetical protein
MASDRQIAANRRNAGKSTGPRSPEGKATSAMNALKSGIDAKSLLIKGEKLADLELLIAEHYRDHSPATAEARALVDEVIRCEWTLRRLSVAETQLWEYDRTAHHRDPKYALGETALCTSSSFTRIQWRMDSTRRALYRALNALRDLKLRPPLALPESEPERLSPPPAPASSESASPEIGFVPQDLPESHSVAPRPPDPARADGDSEAAA